MDRRMSKYFFPERLRFTNFPNRNMEVLLYFEMNEIVISYVFSELFEAPDPFQHI